MKMKKQWQAGLLAFALVTGRTEAQDSRPQTTTGAVTVNDPGGKPGEHLGPVQLVGVVAAVSEGKGFVLVDKREYAACGLSCLAETGTKKIPVRWRGDAPKLEQTVRVAGILSRSEKGLSFVAQELSRP